MQMMMFETAAKIEKSSHRRKPMRRDVDLQAKADSQMTAITRREARKPLQVERMDEDLDRWDGLY